MSKLLRLSFQSSAFGLSALSIPALSIQRRLLSLLIATVIATVFLSIPLLSIAKVYNVEEYVHPVAPAKEHAKLSFVIAKQLQYQHYRQMVLDDKLSSTVFDAFLKSLDPNRTFFLASDIKGSFSHRQ